MTFSPVSRDLIMALELRMVSTGAFCLLPFNWCAWPSTIPAVVFDPVSSIRVLSLMVPSAPPSSSSAAAPSPLTVNVASPVSTVLPLPVAKTPIKVISSLDGWSVSGSNVLPAKFAPLAMRNNVVRAWPLSFITASPILAVAPLPYR